MAKNANSIPVVRLVGDPPKTQRKKAAAETTAEVIKLAVRLDEGINDALRTLIRYRGDLSAMAVEALETVDLSSVALISAERMVRDTTISMPVRLHKGIKKLADQRGTSMNIAVNTALAHWLAAKGAIRLR
jgi:hypothetical protein